MFARMFMQTQKIYEEYLQQIRQLFSDNFWRVFAGLYDLNSGYIDRALKATRSVFVRDVEGKKKFPISVRSILRSTLSAVGDFQSHVMHSITVDLRQFNLPGIPNCRFHFVNPLWAWVQAVNDMVSAGHTLHLKPKVMVHEETRERMYGAGVQFGDVLKFATSKTPRGSNPALFGISFDGGDSGVGDRSVYPVTVSALNFNGANTMACFLVGFLPVLAVSKSFKEDDAYLDVRAHVLQQCIGAIVDELEKIARSGGFTARVAGRVKVFHPFLTAIRVDSKERKMYFGMKSDRYVTHIRG